MYKYLISIGLVISILCVTSQQSMARIQAKLDSEHFVGLDIGATTVFGTYTGFALGLDYEYYYKKSKLGFGIFNQFIIGKHTEYLVGIPLHFHDFFLKDLNVTFAPGLGFIESLNYYNSKLDDNDANVELKLKNQVFRANFMFRMGAAYHFLQEVNGHNLYIVPKLNLDIISGYKTYLTYSVGVKYLFR